MFRTGLIATLLLIASPLSAQEKQLAAMAEGGERAETTVFLAEMADGEFAGAAGAIFITYGQPEWKKEYAAQVDTMTKGKMFRLGKNNWAIMDNTPGITLGGVTVPAGVWYLAIARDQAGKWSLVCSDPIKAKAAGAWPFAADKAPRTHEVPLTAEVLKTEQFAKLTVSLEADKDAPTKGKLVIAWGNHKLSAPYAFKAAAAKDAAAGKGK